MKEKYKCIYNMRLAGYLMQQGFPIRKIEPNIHNTKWDVYMFDYSDKIEEAIEFYKESKRRDDDGIDNKGSRNKGNE